MDKRLEPVQRLQRPFDALGIHAAGRVDALAEAAHDLFVEQHGRRPAQPLIDHQSNRVRPNIHDGDRGNSRQTPLGFRFYHAIPVYLLRPLSQPAMTFGVLDFKASPRPDRLGLVMK